MARTIILKVKYDNFELIPRRYTHDEPFDEVSSIINVIPDLLAKTEAGNRKIRLLGITASNLLPVLKEESEEQLDLF